MGSVFAHKEINPPVLSCSYAPPQEDTGVAVGIEEETQDNQYFSARKHIAANTWNRLKEAVVNAVLSLLNRLLLLL